MPTRTSSSRSGAIWPTRSTWPRWRTWSNSAPSPIRAGCRSTRVGGDARSSGWCRSASARTVPAGYGMAVAGPPAGDGLDHGRIIDRAHERLRGKLSYTNIAFGLARTSSPSPSWPGSTTPSSGTTWTRRTCSASSPGAACWSPPAAPAPPAAPVAARPPGTRSPPGNSGSPTRSPRSGRPDRDCDRGARQAQRGGRDHRWTRPVQPAGAPGRTPRAAPTSSAGPRQGCPAVGRDHRTRRSPAGNGHTASAGHRSPDRHASATSRPPPVSRSWPTSVHSAHMPSPYEAFSTLHPVMSRPSSTIAAAPTCRPEYGQYACSAASATAVRSDSSQQFVEAVNGCPRNGRAVRRAPAVSDVGRPRPTPTTSPRTA